MASLQNLQIDQSYAGLIKTANEQGGAPFPPAPLQYGDGTDTPIAIGDGTSVGVGDIVTISSGTRVIDVNSQNVSIIGLTNVDAQAGTANIVNGTYNFGNPFVTTNVDFANANVTGLPSSGGNAESFGQNITPALGGATQIYSIPWTLSGYSKGAARAFGGNDAMFVPFYAKPGETIDDFYFRIQTAQAGATMNVGLYKSYVATVQTNQKVLMPEYVATIATSVDVSTTGKKSFTGLAQSLPADAVGGQYWIAFLCDTAGVALTKWTNWVAQEQVIYSDIYRGNGVDFNVGSMTLPTGQVNISTGTGSTDLPVDFAWTYQS